LRKQIVGTKGKRTFFRIWPTEVTEKPDNLDYCLHAHNNHTEDKQRMLLTADRWSERYGDKGGTIFKMLNQERTKKKHLLLFLVKKRGFLNKYTKNRISVEQTVPNWWNDRCNNELSRKPNFVFNWVTNDSITSNHGKAK